MQERRAIITVPAELAEVCEGKRIAEVNDRHLRRIFLDNAREWIRVKRLEGEEFIEKYDIHVYGPFPSAARLEAMLSSEHMAITPKERDQITLEKGQFNHYLLNAGFHVARKGAQKGDARGTQILQAV